MKSGPTRTVTAPDGRTWTISVERHRRRHAAEKLDDEKSVDELFTRMPLFLWVTKPIAKVVIPYLDAAVGGRPWVVASAENPPVQMVWRILRTTGRTSVGDTVDEIARALERGTRPAPVAATWIGLEQDGTVAPPDVPPS